jgi:hypothetical protein
MTNHEYPTNDDEIEHAILRDELVDHYLNERHISYGELLAQLHSLGGNVIFHDDEQLTAIAAMYSAETKVEFSERAVPDEYQPGIVTEDSFLVPVARIDRPQEVYRPHLCLTIKNISGVVDTLLLPIAKRSDERYEVIGVRAV